MTHVHRLDGDVRNVCVECGEPVENHAVTMTYSEAVRIVWHVLKPWMGDNLAKLVANQVLDAIGFRQMLHEHSQAARERELQQERIEELDVFKGQSLSLKQQAYQVRKIQEMLARIEELEHRLQYAQTVASEERTGAIVERDAARALADQLAEKLTQQHDDWVFVGTGAPVTYNRTQTLVWHQKRDPNCEICKALVAYEAAKTETGEWK